MVALPRDPSQLPSPENDGLLVGSMKTHSHEKHYYWARVAEASSVATKKTWKGRRACVDLFASCGVSRDESKGSLHWGSPLLALQVRNPFDTYVFGERDASRADALEARARRYAPYDSVVYRLDVNDPEAFRRAQLIRREEVSAPKVVIIRGDANLLTPFVKQLLPAREGMRWTLTMVDPYSAGYAWDALSQFSLHERMDFVILFPEDMDIERNLGLEAAKPESRYDMYFPSREWRNYVHIPGNRGRALREYYKDAMRSQLGYRFGQDKVIRAGGREIYKLLYASRSDLGVKLWDDVGRRDMYGQDAFF